MLEPVRRREAKDEMNESTESKLAEYGWTIECESPLEVRHEDGSFASGQAAEIVIDFLMAEKKE